MRLASIQVESSKGAAAAMGVSGSSSSIAAIRIAPAEKKLANGLRVGLRGRIGLTEMWHVVWRG